MSSHMWIGIDLGTYNSSAAIKNKQRSIEIVKCITGTPGSNFSFLSKHESCKEFPSFISFNKDGSVDCVGMSGKEKMETDSEFVVWGVKRLLGKMYTELKESGELDRFPFRVRPDKTSGQCVVAVGSKSYTPVQICSEIFKKIRSDAQAQVGENLDSVVVSVPAYYDPLRVTPIVEAARLAGFVNVRTIPEPVAAALAYHVDIAFKPIKAIVFDLGAGTLDVTAGYLYRRPGHSDECHFEVTKNTGDPRLGGIDMDDRLLRLIQDQCQVTASAPSDKAALRRIAETVKIQLSEQPMIEHKFEFAGKEQYCVLNQYDLKGALEGCNSNARERNLLEESRRQIMSAIEESGWNPQDVELLLIIGGPTKLPCFYELFKVVFHSNPSILEQLEQFYSGSERIDRMTAVSIGAAMSVDRRVDDRVPHGHGIEDVDISDELMTYRPNILVPRDCPYPFKSKRHMIQWINLNGLFEFKIIQHVPKSEIEQFGYEYRFMGIQKFAVKNPHMCMVSFQMGYNENKELEVSITNAFNPAESVTYVGVTHSACIGMNYPLAVKRPPDIRKSKIKKILPSSETIDKFVKWVQVTVGFIQRKVDNYVIPEMMITQLLHEVHILLKDDSVAAQYENIYTKVNSLIWNANSRGLVTQDEYIQLSNYLGEFETELFRVG